MTCEVHYHLLARPSVETAYQHTCRTIASLYAEQKSALVLCSSDREASVVDDLLWRFDDIAFIPHARNTPQMACPVHITDKGRLVDFQQHFDVLINLSGELAPIDKSDCILEMITDADNAKQSGRDRYRQYQAAGCELQVHRH